jgi:hypothetical protein
MADTAIDICARALVMIGDQPIASFADGTTGATVASNLYEAAVRQALGSYRWRFATGQVQLSRLSTAPDGKWSAAYPLPTDCLEVVTVTVNGYPIDFDRFGGNVLCDASSEDEVILEAVFRVDENQFPPYFTGYLEQVLASQFALAVAARTELSDYLDKRAMRFAMIARNIDAQGRTADRIDTTGIIAARRRTGRK